jgi:hypothetical protein
MNVVMVTTQLAVPQHAHSALLGTTVRIKLQQQFLLVQLEPLRLVLPRHAPFAQQGMLAPLQIVMTKYNVMLEPGQQGVSLSALSAPLATSALQSIQILLRHVAQGTTHWVGSSSVQSAHTITNVLPPLMYQSRVRQMSTNGGATLTVGHVLLAMSVAMVGPITVGLAIGLALGRAIAANVMQAIRVQIITLLALQRLLAPWVTTVQKVRDHLSRAHQGHKE